MLFRSVSQSRYFSDGLEANVAEKLKEIREKDEILLRQSRHASMGEMISVIAHQWKQPLNIVSVMSQEIHYAVDMDDEIDREFLKKLSTDINGQVTYMASNIKIEERKKALDKLHDKEKSTEQSGGSATALTTE